MGESDDQRSNMKKLTSIVSVSDKLKNGDLSMKIEAAREIRSMIRDRNSGGKIRSKFGGVGVIRPLVDMLCLENDDAVEISLLTLLNLASKNKRNKEEIVTCGAIPPLVNLLKLQNTSNLGELAIAAIVTLSASPNNKAAIANSEAIPLLIQIISSDGTIQGRVDAVSALHNLATSKQEPTIILDTIATSPLINLLKECKKYSKFAERATALIEIISKSQEGINAITNLKINLSQCVLEKMVQEIAARVDGSERRRAETAKKLMQDMVQRRMARV
ncbi:putative armadillo-like helical protein [Tanacetum coccineum]